jgi:predicted secreted Zn-dependent protease
MSNSEDYEVDYERDSDNNNGDCQLVGDEFALVAAGTPENGI